MYMYTSIMHLSSRPGVSTGGKAMTGKILRDERTDGFTRQMPEPARAASKGAMGEKASVEATSAATRPRTMPVFIFEILFAGM